MPTWSRMAFMVHPVDELGYRRIRIDLALRDALGDPVDVACRQRRLQALHQLTRQQFAEPHSLPLPAPAGLLFGRVLAEPGDLSPQLVNANRTGGFRLHDGWLPF